MSSPVGFFKSSLVIPEHFPPEREDPTSKRPRESQSTISSSSQAAVLNGERVSVLLPFLPQARKKQRSSDLERGEKYSSDAFGSSPKIFPTGELLHFIAFRMHELVPSILELWQSACEMLMNEEMKKGIFFGDSQQGLQGDLGEKLFAATLEVPNSSFFGKPPKDLVEATMQKVSIKLSAYFESLKNEKGLYLIKKKDSSAHYLTPAQFESLSDSLKYFISLNSMGEIANIWQPFKRENSQAIGNKSPPVFHPVLNTKNNLIHFLATRVHDATLVILRKWQSNLELFKGISGMKEGIFFERLNSSFEKELAEKIFAFTLAILIPSQESSEGKEKYIQEEVENKISTYFKGLIGRPELGLCLRERSGNRYSLDKNNVEALKSFLASEVKRELHSAFQTFILFNASLQSMSPVSFSGPLVVPASSQEGTSQKRFQNLLMVAARESATGSSSSSSSSRVQQGAFGKPFEYYAENFFSGLQLWIASARAITGGSRKANEKKLTALKTLHKELFKEEEITINDQRGLSIARLLEVCNQYERQERKRGIKNFLQFLKDGLKSSVNKNRYEKIIKDTINEVKERILEREWQNREALGERASRFHED